MIEWSNEESNDEDKVNNEYKNKMIKTFEVDNTKCNTIEISSSLKKSVENNLNQFIDRIWCGSVSRGVHLDSKVVGFYQTINCDK